MGNFGKRLGGRMSMVAALWLVLSTAATGVVAGEKGSRPVQGQVPDCPAFGWPNSISNLPINNAQVLHWKRTTKNQYQDRGHVQGPIVEIYRDRNGHQHFEIQLGKSKTDTIEVIYNKDFGALPELKMGMTVEACGDYITSIAPSGPYPASPAGAIIHWVHANPRGKGHPPGYLVVDGKVCGQDIDNAGPRRHDEVDEVNEMSESYLEEVAF